MPLDAALVLGDSADYLWFINTAPIRMSGRGRPSIHKSNPPPMYVHSSDEFDWTLAGRSVMPEQREQGDDWKRNADEPQESASA